MILSLKSPHLVVAKTLSPERSFTAAPDLRMDLARTDAEFLALEPEWDALLSRSATQTPFLRWDWVRGWWELYRDVCRPVIGVARDSFGRALAIAPFVIGNRDAWPHRHLRQIAFAGTIGEIASQEMDVIAPEEESDTAEALVAHVLRSTRSEWDMARIDGLPEGSPHLEGMLRALTSRSQRASVLNRTPTHYMRTPATWEEFEMSRSGSWRSKIRRKWKALAAQPQMHTSFAGDDCTPQEAFSKLAHLHEVHYPKGVSDFLRPRSLQFHRKLVEGWIPQKRALLPCIELRGSVVGATYGFVEGERFFLYQMGWDPAFQDLSLGQLSVAWGVRAAIEHGARDFDMLPGAEGYKSRWCSEVRHLLDLEGFNPTSMRAIMFRMMRSVRRLRGQSEVTKATAAPAPDTHTEE